MIPSSGVYTPQGGPPTKRPNPLIYQRMGEENIYRMIEDFYLELEKSEIRFMFGQDMKEASQRTADFFIFLLGGPPIYHEKHGPPMMRKRHLSFPIDEKARLAWINCFRATLENGEEKYRFPAEYQEEFWQFLESFSLWMVNRPPSLQS